MNILMVGVGGYAARYAKELLEYTGEDIAWVGIVDPYYDACPHKAEIDARGIPVYQTMEGFYEEREADLAVISTPPFLHCEQSIFAVTHGSHVLCEKPVAPTVEEAQRMLEAERQYGRFIAIGYQWSFSDAIQELKRDVLSGALGKPLSFKTAISWPRNFAYYGRGGGWGGRLTWNDRPILDSIASNACAHYLHNMLFLLGRSMDSSAEITCLEADCLRANKIESFDTCALKMKTQEGTELFFVASHATQTRREPQFVYRFENATVTFSEASESRIKAVFSDGRVKDYGDPFANNFKKLWDCIDAVRQGSVPSCTVKAAMAHTKLIERLHAETSIRNFPSDKIRLLEDGSGLYVEGLFEKLYQAYDEERLFSELQ